MGWADGETILKQLRVQHEGTGDEVADAALRWADRQVEWLSFDVGEIAAWAMLLEYEAIAVARVLYSTPP